MLIVSPALAEAALVCLQPGFTGERVGFLSFIGFFLFSLPFVFVTIPLWPTYIPAIIFTPLVMRRVAMLYTFRTLKLPVILGIALLVGAVVGVIIMTWLIIIAARDSWAVALSWAGAGAFSGSITLALITLIYRYEPRAA
jgi:hypothetical protein